MSLPVAREETAQAADSARPKSVFRVLEIALLAVAAVLYALHFVHLRADFPNHTRWQDWAKYTDEGWYGLAAIRHYQLGHWNLPGDFNPAAALPVWPLLELVVFRFTGVSLIAARALSVAVFGLILPCCWLLLRRWAKEENASGPLAPAIAVLLLAASPFLFVFSRLAILEPLMILLGLAALLLARRAGALSVAAWGPDAREAQQADRRAVTRALAWSAGLGLVIVAMVLTKTTGLFLVPAIAWMLWASCAHRVRVALRAGGIAAAFAAIAWGGYMLLFVRPRYMEDYRYLFSANGYTRITRATFWPVFNQTLLSIGFAGTAIFWMGVAAVIAALTAIIARRLRGDALTVSLLLWMFFYLAFLAYHDNLSPRYYQAVAIPLTMLIAMIFERLWRAALVWREGNPADRMLLRLAAVAAGVAIVFTAVRGAEEETRFLRHPEYSFVSAVNHIHAAIERQRADDQSAGMPVHPELVLSISGAQMQLIDGLPSICDDFGTMTLPDRIGAYPPGWFVAWNDVEDDKMEALAPVYKLVRVGAWPAFDDAERNLMVLYRLDPLPEAGKGNGRGRRTINGPRRLKTKVGGQPTVNLEH